MIDIKPLKHFIIQFDIHQMDFHSENIYVSENKYYLMEQDMKKIVESGKKIFSAGKRMMKLPFHVWIYIYRVISSSFP